MHATTRERMGWLPDIPDYRDRRLSAHPVVGLGVMGAPTPEELPAFISLRDHCPPVRDQGQLGSCTGFAHASAVGYLNRVDVDPRKPNFSESWMYYQARKIEGSINEDAGAYIRDGAKVLATLGIPNESYWPYVIDRFTDMPTRTAYKEAERWKVGPYYRCDSLDGIRTALACRFAVVGGFSFYENMFSAEADRTGDFPMPGGSLEGGHAVHFIGYDDGRRRLLLKNSWGENWGDGGYGTLPYGFVEEGLADDFWCYERESDATVHPKPRS